MWPTYNFESIKHFKNNTTPFNISYGSIVNQTLDHTICTKWFSRLIIATREDFISKQQFGKKR